MADSSDGEFVVVNKNEVPPAAEISQEIIRLRVWLQPTAYLGDSSEFQQHLNWLVPGTGEWIQETPQFQQWRDSSTHGALWIKAIAGAGKSVLVSHLISYLQQLNQKTNTPVLFFFFRQIVVANHGPHALIRDWMAQLLPFSPELERKLTDMQAHNRQVQDVAFQELWQALLDAISSLDRVYCVVDALDELDSEHTDEFLHHLLALGKAHPDRVKLAMSSRPLPQIQKVLSDPSVLELRLENAQVNGDIVLFVDYRLRQASNLSDAVLAEIEQTIKTRVHPSFLYARLFLNEFLGQHGDKELSVESVRHSLRSIPSSLEDLYAQMLKDHSQRASVPQNRQFLILQLVTHATRPLRLLEIATILDFLSTNDGQEQPREAKALARLSCGPLLEILEDETVCVIHHSFTEFLTDPHRTSPSGQDGDSFPVIDRTATHCLIASVCLRYMSSVGLLKSKPKDILRTAGVSNDSQLHHPFIKYAAENWFIHVQHLPTVDGGLLDLLNQFMRTENETFLTWMDSVMITGLGDRVVKGFSPLHAAAWAGIANYAQTLLVQGQDPNTQNTNQETPLTIAARRGFVDVVELLLQYGAAPDDPDYDGLKPMHYAARANHHTVVQALLDNHVSPMTPRTHDPSPGFCGNARSTIGDTPLQYASHAGAIQSIRAMLPHLTIEDAQEALLWAIERRHLELVNLLVHFGGLDFTSHWGTRCLRTSVEQRHAEILKLLLELGANPDYQPRGHWPAIGQRQTSSPGSGLLLALCKSRRLSSSASSDFEKCLDIILQTGCDVNKPDVPSGDTALHFLVRGNLPGVEKLLRHGADVNAVDSGGETPLHLYRPCKESQPTLDLLMRHGARWDVIRHRDGRTPLHTCLERMHPDLEVLRPYVSDWNVPDANGNTPLHRVQWGTALPVEQLVAMGADPNHRNHDGHTPLHSALSVEEIKSLLVVGADLEARDRKGRTVFLNRVSKGMKRDGLQQLLDMGANLHAVDFGGDGALHVASESYETFQFLLDAGVAPCHRNYAGDTVLHVIMRRVWDSSHTTDHLRIVDDVLKKTAICPTAQNNDGQTILHLMCGAPLRMRQSSLEPEMNPMELFPLATVAALIEREDFRGWRPIHDAAGTSEYLVDWLIGKGASLTALTHRRENPVHLAAISGQTNTVGLLLEHLTEVERIQSANQRDREGLTPLHHACISGNLQSVVYLLNAGADVDITDNNLQTPLHACARFRPTWGPPSDPGTSSQRSRSHPVRGCDEALGVGAIIRLLQSHGANIIALDKKNRTPLELAVDYQNEEMVVTLLDATTEALRSDERRSSRALKPTGQLLLTARQRCLETVGYELASKDKLDAVGVARWLLKLRAYGAVERVATDGCSIAAITKYSTDWPDFLHDLARWGLADLFETLGKLRNATQWINGSPPGRTNHQMQIDPFIMTVVGRAMPSPDLLRVVVETFHADVNIQVQGGWPPHSRIESFLQSPLGTLAKGEHWWHTDGVRYLLEHGANPNLRDHEGQTPLFIAVRGGYRRVGIIEALLASGADPNLLDKEGRTVLNLAAGDSQVVQLLLRHGADIHLGSTPFLYTAILKQDVATVRVILEAGVDCNQPFKSEHSAPEPEPQPGLRPRESRWDIEARAQKAAYKEKMLHCTPLHFACDARFNDAGDRVKALAVVRLLLDFGASPFLPTGEKNTILIHDILHQGGLLEPLLDIPQLDLEQRDRSGRTLLLAACEVDKRHAGSLEIGKAVQPFTPDAIRRLQVIRQLCEMGADICAVNNDGDTALHLVLAGARREGYITVEPVDLVEFLIARSPALVHQCNHHGYTPFHIAAESRLVGLLPILLDNGANILDPDPNGDSILHHLAIHMVRAQAKKSWTLSDEGQGVWAFVDRAMQSGLDINAQNNKGESPIFKYVGSGYCHITLRESPPFQALLQAGADPLMRSNAGENLLHLLARLPCDGAFSISFYGKKHHVESFEYLMELGLDPFQEDLNQRSAVDVAAAYEKEDILALFQKS